MSKAHRFARNVSWNMLGQAVAAAANFLFIPYLVRHLGQAQYGLYILLSTVASYLMLLTFGAADATIKFVAEHHGAKDGRALKDTLKYSLVIHGLGVLPGAAVLAFGARFFAFRLFHVPREMLDLAGPVMICAALGAVLAAIIAFSGATMQGLQRFDWYNGLSTLQNAVLPFGAAAAVALGAGVVGAAKAYVALSAVTAFLGVFVVTALVEKLEFKEAGRGINFGAFRDYGLSMWLSLVAWVVTFQFDKIFLARGTSLSDLTLYSVPSGLLQRVQVMGVVVSAVVLPMMSELNGPHTHDQLVRMYLKSSRFLLWAVLPALIMLFVLMPQFLTLWLGGEFGSRGVWPARIVVLAKLFFILNAIPNAVVCSRGKPWAMTVMIWSQAVISLLAWKLMVPRLGILGVAWGSLAAQVAPTIVYLLWLHEKILRLGEGEFLKEALYAPVLSALVLTVFVFPVHPLVQAWPALIGVVCGGLALYYGSTWWLLSFEDKQFVKALIFRERAALEGA